MFNLLRAECYKLKRSKNLRICALTIMAVIFLLYGMLTVAEGIINGDMENGTAGVVVSQSGQENMAFLAEMSAMDVMQQLFSGDLMAIVLACFTGIIVAGEYGSGTVKNIVGKGYARGTIFLARYLAIVLGIVLLLIFGAVVNMAGAILVLGKGAFNTWVWKDVGIYMGLQIIICIALGAVFTLVAELGRNMAAAIVMCIGTVIFPELLMGGLDMIFSHTGFQPSQYWLVSMCESCPISEIGAGFAGRTAGVALLWVVAALAAGIWHFKKADIK